MVLHPHIDIIPHIYHIANSRIPDRYGIKTKVK